MEHAALCVYLAPAVHACFCLMTQKASIFGAQSVEGLVL